MTYRGPVDGSSEWVAVLPMKELARAKMRLAADAGPWRQRLASAFAQDTVDALRRSTSVRDLVLVGGDLLPAGAVVDLHLHLHRLPDVPELNAAVSAGLRWVAATRPERPVLVLTCDLPSATASLVDALLAEAPSDRVAVLADSEGSGTVALLIPAGVVVRPRFGTGSLAAHRADGAVAITRREFAPLRRDVDTVEHLQQARRFGVGEHTAAVLAAMDRQVSNEVRLR